jgi:PadR family transcriptional regulator PadR
LLAEAKACRHIDGILFSDHLVGRKSVLGEFEQTVMLAILQLGDDAYAPSIARHLEATIDRSVSRGALYSCLNQLERKGFLRWRVDAPTPERAGHARRFYQVSARGVRALRIARESQLMLWRGLEGILGATK